MTAYPSARKDMWRRRPHRPWPVRADRNRRGSVPWVAKPSSLPRSAHIRRAPVSPGSHSQNRAAESPPWPMPQGSRADARAWRRRSPRACRLRSWSGYRTFAFGLAVGDRYQVPEARRRGAAVDRLHADRNPFLQRRGAAGHDQRRRGIQKRDVAVGTWLTIENAAQRNRISVGVATPQRLTADARKARVLRRNLEASDPAILERGDEGRPGQRDLVKSVRAMHHPDRFGAEVFQHLRQRLHPLPGEDADHLPPDSGGIGQRPEQVENGAGR